MDLIQAQISEISKLNLIYIYTIDSVFKDGSNRYVGAKVIYGNNKYYEMDYSNPHFEEFLKHLRNKYLEEKDARNIVLLGDLSKKILNDEYFVYLSKNDSKQKSITSFSSNNEYIHKYKEIIFDLVKSILKFYKKYELIKITDMTGYNNKWNIVYYVGSIKKNLAILVKPDADENLNIKISFIDNSVVDIDALIITDKTILEITWKDNNSKVNGKIEYDPKKQNAIQSIFEDEQIIAREVNSNDIDKKDLELIDRFNKTFNLENREFIKIGSETYLAYNYHEDKANEDETIYSVDRVFLTMQNDRMIYERRTKQGLSKYDSQILVNLDEIIDYGSLFFIKDFDDTYAVIENNHKQLECNTTKYSYFHDDQIIEINDSVESVMDIKKLIRKNGGK